MYGLLLAIAPSGAALGAIVLNRLAITLVEAGLLLFGGAALPADPRRALAAAGRAARVADPPRGREVTGLSQARLLSIQPEPL